MSRQISHPHLTDIKQKWWQLASIQSAGTSSLPIVLFGSLISSSYGIYNAILSILAGNVILMFIGLTINHLSFYKRQSVLELARDYIGYYGGMIVGGALVVFVIFGWIPLQLNLAESELLQVRTIQKYICEENCSIKIPIILGVISSAIACFGIKGIKWTALFSMPFILIFLSIALFHIDFLNKAKNQSFSLAGLPLAIGFGLSWVTDFPTFFRHSKNTHHSIIGAVTTFVILSLGEILGAFLAGGDQQISSNLIQQLQISIHPLFIGFIVVLAAINANNGNIYLASVGWEIWVPKILGKQEYFILGLGGIVSYSLINSTEFFHLVVEYCDIIICSFTGVLMSCYICSQTKKKKVHGKQETSLGFISWIIGIILGVFIKSTTTFLTFPSMLVALLGSLASLSFLFYFRKIIKRFNASNKNLF